MSAVLWAALLAAAQFSGIRSAFAFEEPPEDTELGPIFLLSLGGKLYDDLWLVLEVEPPAEGNSAIPAEAAAAARATWRCVTCHGWSYSGTEVGGASFPGLLHLAGADAEVIKPSVSG